MMIALDGVTKFGLEAAVRSVLRGGLGHPFFPKPPELRLHCDRMMLPHEDRRDRQKRLERIAAETPKEIERTPEGRSRVTAAYQRFLDGYTVESRIKLETERALIRAEYGLTPEVLAGMKDRG